jgi:hypothetical protein
MTPLKIFFINLFLLIGLCAEANVLIYTPNFNTPTNIVKVGKSANWEDFRFGFGVGYGLYVTNQMDYKITTNYGDFKELIPTYFASVYKNVNNNLEVGLLARFGSLLTLKSENTQGSSCDFNEVQASVVHSFNKDIGMEGKPFTINGIFSLGITNFKSKFFSIDPITEKEKKIFSQVGYGGVEDKLNQPVRQTAIIGNTGIAMGYRFSRSLSMYWENTFNLSTSNKMTGNLNKKSYIPTDGYFFSSVGLYIRFSDRKGQLSCPRF